MDKDFLKPYDPIENEGNIYKLWEKSGYFNPDNCIKDGHTKKDAPAFSIVLPPPNVTGTLHLGHASMLAIEDTLVRFKRMQGHKTLWLPGTDHAAIATQSKVEKNLAKQKIRKEDLGRVHFLEEVKRFADDSHSTIVNQIRAMGSSVDWSREAYTLDKERELAVRTAFKTFYDKGLIYQGEKIVNWDPRGQTVISDDEIVYLEEKTPFYYLKYGPFTIATARPETKFGDKYVVMHPDDIRYTDYKHGQKIEVEWINGKIQATIIKDEAIDMEFGTGVMTITPWHDATDFEIAERHNLDKQQIIDKYGKLLPIAGELSGLKIKEARQKIIEILDKKGLVKKIDEDYSHKIATAERTGGVIEPQIMKQWFVNVNKEFVLEKSEIKGIKDGDTVTLKKLMKHVVESNQVEIIPDRFNKTYYHWIDNLRDWCISRQIWFGHQIPVWYKGDEIYVGIEAPKEEGWTQDEDTLDTWFSSGLWTFSTLGWPNQTNDFKTYHPTNLLETGYDILFFWVARMILMSTSLIGQIPFKTVYLHGLVRDSKGAKMSKSLGNIIDPLDMSKKYGADAVRLSLIIGTGPGNDSKLSEDKIRAYKKFANKMWNASRFVLEQNITPDIINKNKPKLNKKHKKYIDDFEIFKKEITKELEEYKLYLVGEKLYHYFWHQFADIIIEDCKNTLNNEKSSKEDIYSAKWTLYKILKDSLILLHPFTPFITERIWQSLPHQKEGKLLIIERWPV